MIQNCVDRQEILGTVAILTKNGQIGYYKSFGWADIESQKMRKDDCFR